MCSNACLNQCFTGMDSSRQKADDALSTNKQKLPLHDHAS